MQGQMEKMIRRYGSPMVLRQDGAEYEIRAFLQQTRSRSQSHAERQLAPLGEVPKGLFVYLGPVTPQIAEGDMLVYRQRNFQVRRAEPIVVGDSVAYCWGLCVEMGGDHIWGS